MESGPAVLDCFRRCSEVRYHRGTPDREGFDNRTSEGLVSERGENDRSRRLDQGRDLGRRSAAVEDNLSWAETKRSRRRLERCPLIPVTGDHQAPVVSQTRVLPSSEQNVDALFLRQAP